MDWNVLVFIRINQKPVPLDPARSCHINFFFVSEPVPCSSGRRNNQKPVPLIYAIRRIILSSMLYNLRITRSRSQIRQSKGEAYLFNINFSFLYI